MDRMRSVLRQLAGNEEGSNMHDGLTLDLVICAVFTPFVNIIVMTAVWGIWGFVIGAILTVSIVLLVRHEINKQIS
jgi:hypothetical protein